MMAMPWLVVLVTGGGSNPKNASNIPACSVAVKDGAAHIISNFEFTTAPP